MAAGRQPSALNTEIFCCGPSFILHLFTFNSLPLIERGQPATLDRRARIMSRFAAFVKRRCGSNLKATQLQQLAASLVAECQSLRCGSEGSKSDQVENSKGIRTFERAAASNLRGDRKTGRKREATDWTGTIAPRLAYWTDTVPYGAD